MISNTYGYIYIYTGWLHIYIQDGVYIYIQDGVISEEKADEFKNEVDLPRLLLKITVIILLCISGRVRVYVTSSSH